MKIEQWVPKIVPVKGGGFVVVYPFGEVVVPPDPSRHLRRVKRCL